MGRPCCFAMFFVYALSSSQMFHHVFHMCLLVIVCPTSSRRVCRYAQSMPRDPPGPSTPTMSAIPMSPMSPMSLWFCEALTSFVTAVNSAAEYLQSFSECCFDSMRSNKTSGLQGCKVCNMLTNMEKQLHHLLSIGIAARPLGTERPDL